jgi:hypothetical protein
VNKSTGWTRDLTGFHHKERGLTPVAQVTGAALRASIAWGRTAPAPHHTDYAAIRTIHEAGHEWGLPPGSDEPGVEERVWQAWVVVYRDAHNHDQGNVIPLDEAEAAIHLRHHYLFYLQSLQEELDDMAEDCAAGPRHDRPELAGRATPRARPLRGLVRGRPGHSRHGVPPCHAPGLRQDRRGDDRARRQFYTGRLTYGTKGGVRTGPRLHHPLSRYRGFFIWRLSCSDSNGLVRR